MARPRPSPVVRTAALKARCAPAGAGRTPVLARAKASAQWGPRKLGPAQREPLKSACVALRARGGSGQTARRRQSAQWARSTVSPALAAAAAAPKSALERASVGSGEHGAATGHARVMVASARPVRPTPRRGRARGAAARVLEPVHAEATAVGGATALGARVPAAPARLDRPAPAPTVTPAAKSGVRAAARGLDARLGPRPSVSVFGRERAARRETISSAARPQAALRGGSSAYRPASGRRSAMLIAAELV